MLFKPLALALSLAAAVQATASASTSLYGGVTLSGLEFGISARGAASSKTSYSAPDISQGASLSLLTTAGSS